MTKTQALVMFSRGAGFRQSASPGRWGALRPGPRPWALTMVNDTPRNWQPRPRLLEALGKTGLSAMAREDGPDHLIALNAPARPSGGAAPLTEAMNNRDGP